jgi:hypothetical protein
MGGKPDWFEVTNLEVLESMGAPGSAMKDVIVVKTAPPGDAFRLVVTFEGNPNQPLAASWLYLAEADSDSTTTPAIPAEAKFWAESIGPGDEVLIGAASVNLKAGGNPGGHPSVNASLYQAILDIPNANAIFVNGVGVLQPGLYRIGCAVHTDWTFMGITQYADAYYDQDLVISVVQQP